MSKQWGLPLKWQEIADACHDCVICAQDEPQWRKLLWETQQLTRGRVPLTHWQVDYIGSLPRASNATYAFTAIDMATGCCLLGCVWQQINSILWPLLRGSVPSTGAPKLFRVTEALTLRDKKCSAGLPGWTYSGCSTPCTTHTQLVQLNAATAF